MIHVNGEEMAWEEGMTVQDVLDRRNYTFPQIIVKVNDELVLREAYASYRVPDDADVRAIHLISGGAGGTMEQAARRIFGERAAFYTTSKTHRDPQVLARLVELASPQPGWRVLDVGTGTGHTAFALAPHVAMVLGLDLTPEMLDEARTLQREYGFAHTAWGLADVHRLPFSDGSFHLVACRRAAHHFADIRWALAEMQRVLRSGGRLVIDDRSVPEDDFVDACMNELDRYHDESHVRQYRPSEWQRMLEGTGLVVEAVEPYTQHRPLSSLTHGVSRENVENIHRVLERLDEDQQQTFNLMQVDGTPYLNHWYVMVAATKES